jgi:hypothetical protein
MNPLGMVPQGDSALPGGTGVPGEPIADRGDATAMRHAGSAARTMTWSAVLTVHGTPVPAVRIAPTGPISEDAAELAVLQARRLFERALAAWVVDLLALRRAGLDQPAWNAARQARLWRKAA